MSSGAWTAVGTIALAIVTLATVVVTVGITRQDRGRADKKLAEEVKRNQDRIDDERRVATEREQFAEASLVEVVLAVPKGGIDFAGTKPPPQLELTVRNHGHYAITGIQATAVHPAGVVGFIEPRQEQRWDAFNPNSQYVEPVPGAHPDWLPPWDARLIFRGDLPDSLKGKKDDLAVYPVVRWTDRWGTGWQHRRGKLLKADSPDGLRFAWDESGPIEPPPPPPSLGWLMLPVATRHLLRVPSAQPSRVWFGVGQFAARSGRLMLRWA